MRDIFLLAGCILLNQVDCHSFSNVIPNQAVVGTSDGKRTILRMTFRDYGLVTMWSVSPAGDGPKPTSIIWE
jgi:hypothetical protein